MNTDKTPPPAHLQAILREGFEEFRQFVNPGIAERAMLVGEPVRAVATHDGRLVMEDGSEIDDFHGTQALGHRNPHVTAAVTDYLQTKAPNWYPSRVNPWMGRLARRLYERTGYDRAYFGLSGSDGVEAALKLARAATGRPRLLGLMGAYHGCAWGSCALMTPGIFKDPFAPHLPGTESLPFGDITALEAALRTEDVAAVVVEPIQVEGGVRALPADYVEALCALTQRHGALLVADEAQTGLGRTGVGFLMSSAWPRRPDVALLAKTLGGGLVPISAMLTCAPLFERAYGQDYASAEAHNSTFSNHGLGAVAALATLDLLTDDLIAQVAQRGASLMDALRARLSKNPLFSEVRGAGLTIGIELHDPDHPWLSYDHFGLPSLSGQPVIAPLLCYRLYKKGFFTFTCGHRWSTLRIQPRYDLPAQRFDAFVDACGASLDALADLL